jgi:lysozyme family protein
MKTVHQLAAEIVAREGGFVHDPDDPGGATKHGVTLGTMRRLGLDLNRDQRVDLADVRALTAQQAIDIYVEDYFNRTGIAALPEPLQASVFDMYVNAGNTAVKLLQRLLSRLWTH